MLTTSNEYSTVFLETKRLLLDSCILNDLATKQRTQEILNRAASSYSFVYCSVSMLEVGFGPRDKVDVLQDKLARSIYHDDHVIEMSDYGFRIRELNKIQDPPGTVYSYIPGRNEWYAARHKLIQAMEILEIGGRRARGLSNDAIISMSAWNSRSALITNNVKDFDLFNRVFASEHPSHLLPIFTLEDLERSFEEDVCFPENVEKLMRRSST